MVEGYVDDTVPCFIDSCEMFGGFFDQGEQDETEELIWYAGFNDFFNL